MLWRGNWVELKLGRINLLHILYNAPINVKPAEGGGGGGAGHGVGIWHFSKICRQIPCPRANHSSQMQPNSPTPGCTCQISQGWTQERHNKNISKQNSAVLIYKRCCITKDTCSCYIDLQLYVLTNQSVLHCVEYRNLHEKVHIL